MDVAASNHSYCGIGERTWYLEWLRVSACLAVVLIHCFTTLLDNASIDEVGIFRALAWTEVLVVFCRWAVPVFLMVTGSLLLDPARRVTWNKNLWYVFRVATVLLTFGTMFALMELVFSSKNFEVSMVPAAIGNVLQGRGWAHFWYLYDLLGIYLLLPLLRAFAAASTREDMRRMLVVLFIFSLAVPTLNAAVGLDASTFIWLGSSAFYVMLGRYLSAYNIRVAPVLLAGTVSVVLQALLAGGGIVADGTYLRWVWSPSSPFVAIWAAAVFLLFKNHMDVPMAERGFARLVASYSFAVYVIHPVFTNLLYKATGWGEVQLPPIAFEVTTFLAVFIPSLCVAWVLKRTPMMRKVL